MRAASVAVQRLAALPSSASSTCALSVRCLGTAGHGHGAAADHGHGEAAAHLSPAAAAHEAQVPQLFGEPARARGERRPREDWESSFFLLLGGTALVVALGSRKPNANVRDWARDEARERVRRAEVRLFPPTGRACAGSARLRVRADAAR